MSKRKCAHSKVIAQVKNAAAVIAFCYITVSGLSVLAGIIATHHDCERPTTRIGKLIPTFQLGCWLSETPDAQK